MHPPERHTCPGRDPAAADPVLDPRPAWDRSEDGLGSSAIRDAQDLASFSAVKVLGQALFQLAAFLTRAAILASSSGVSFVSANEVGHIVPSSRFAASSKPNVA